MYYFTSQAITGKGPLPLVIEDHSYKGMALGKSPKSLHGSIVRVAVLPKVRDSEQLGSLCILIHRLDYMASSQIYWKDDDQQIAPPEYHSVFLYRLKDDCKHDVLAGFTSIRLNAIFILICRALCHLEEQH